LIYNIAGNDNFIFLVKNGGISSEDYQNKACDELQRLSVDRLQVCRLRCSYYYSPVV